MNRRPRPVWPVVAAAQVDPPGQRPWRLRHLLLAPHRLAFALALLLLLSTAAWWVLVQVDQLAGVPGLPYALSPALGHAAVMTFGFMPLFFSGFLFTAGPKWLGVAPLQAAALLAPLLLQTVGWLLWMFGLHLGLGLALAGLAAALSGLVWVGVLFWPHNGRSQRPLGLPESAVEAYSAQSEEHTPPPRAVQSNKVYQPQGRPMMNSHVASRLINAVR